MLRFGVIGYPVAHSLSPQIHGAAFQATGIDAISEKIEVQPKDLENFMKDFRKKFAGINVTIPHKETIMSFLDEIDPEAKAIGAVNTVVNKNGRLIGYNTDMYGAMKALTETPLPWDFSIWPEHGKNALQQELNVCLDICLAGVIGGGGAARAITYGLLRLGASVEIFNRTPEKARKIAEEFNCLEGDGIEDFDPVHDILINATSCGMSPNEDETPIPNLSKGLQKEPHMLVMDVIYLPRETRFIREARAAGCEVITGERMFFHQAVRGFELWTGKKAPLETMEKVLYQALEEREKEMSS